MQLSNVAKIGIGLAGFFLIIFIIGIVVVFTATLNSTPNIPPDLNARVGSADPAAGKTYFTQYGCIGCHGSPNGTGPYYVGIGKRAAQRRAPSYDAPAYLYESIVSPNAYVVPGYPASVMPQDFSQKIPQDQIYDIIAWLLLQ